MSIASRIDPTRTSSLRRRLAAATAARFRRVSQRLRELVDRDDAFGLKVGPMPTGGMMPLVGMPGQRRWAGLDTASQVKTFRAWLKGQLSSLLLSHHGAGTFWTDPFIAAAYRRGILNAYGAARPDPMVGQDERYEGGKAQFLHDLTGTAAGLARVRQLQDRAADGIEDQTSTLFARLARTLGDGLTSGAKPADLVEALVKAVRAVTARALTLARSEITYSHAEAQLDAFERLGIQHLQREPESRPARVRGIVGNASKYDGMKAYWDTTGGKNVCPLCIAKEGNIYTVKYARGLIPLHPGCLCSWKLVEDPDLIPLPDATLADGSTVEFARRKDQNKRTEVTIMVDPKKLDAGWRRGDPSLYIPPGGGGAEIGGRRADFTKFLAKGQAIQASRGGLHKGKFYLDDGRHRFSVLRDLGADRVAITVPRRDAKAILRRYGVTKKRAKVAATFPGEVR